MAGPALPVSHIWYASGETSICQDKVMIPDAPVKFDEIEGVACLKCNLKMMKWLTWWVNQDTKEQ